MKRTGKVLLIPALVLWAGAATGQDEEFVWRPTIAPSESTSTPPPPTVSPPPATTPTTSTTGVPVATTVEQPIGRAGAQHPASHAQYDARVGTFYMAITLINNMEQGYQITNEGYRAVIVDATSRELLAQGSLSFKAVIDGKPATYVKQRGWTDPWELNIPLHYVKPDLALGTRDVRLAICMPTELDAAWDKAPKCQRLGMDGERPATIDYLSARIEVTDAGIVFKRISGFPVSRSGSAACGSVEAPCPPSAHPLYAALMPAKATIDGNSPLVLDLDGDGALALSDVRDERHVVTYDLEGSGRPMPTGWIGKGDGLLAVDLDGDGRIGSGRELFGQYSHALAPTVTGLRATFANGFQALAQYDANQDGRIDAADPIYARLVVWQDLNRDGVSQKRELRSLAAARVQSLSLAYVEHSTAQSPAQSGGNELKLKSSYRTAAGREHALYDVWFKVMRPIGPVATGR